ncbi:MAG: hypothetical protein JRJ87_18665 [Deltaproteobacteria bacterium]|nr:hypothetical protein [Deltaproteobacteria bacterium]
MSDVIPITLVVEDVLSEEALRKILKDSKRPYYVGAVYSKKGFGYIKSRIEGFNQAAQGSPFLVLTDLDQAECPPTLIADWLKRPANHNLLFRIAVREVDAWLMADRKAFARYLGIAQELVPQYPERLKKPKQKLITLARKSKKKSIRNAIVPAPNVTARTGPDYNGTLSVFVREHWSPGRAKSNAKSLNRIIDAVEKFEPVYSQGGS